MERSIGASIVIAIHSPDFMTASFNEFGFHFKYPENWTVERDAVEGWPRSVSVHAPSGAFWMVTEDPNAPDLIDRMIQVMTQQYEEVETDPVQQQIGPLSLQGTTMEFFCLDFLITAQAVRCDRSSRQIVVWTQAESREYESLAAVFDAMTYSLFEQL